MYRISCSAILEVETFVKTVCGSRGSSHNHQHMMKVRDNSQKILLCLVGIYWILLYLITKVAQASNIMGSNAVFVTSFIGNLFLMIHIDAIVVMINIVALLHDVADHKYISENPELSETLDSFLTRFVNNPAYFHQVQGTVMEHLFNKISINNIIDRISYSRQKSQGTTDWYPVLGFSGLLIRNIVSDADKFEAINIPRCIEYTKEKLLGENKSIDLMDIKKAVTKHYYEKLIRLPTMEYMKTFPGWLYAKLILYPDMRNEFNALNNREI